MAANEILQFAGTDTGTNLLTQAQYDADAQRPIGNQPGIARSPLVNKALRQSSLMSAALAQFIADNQLNDVVDTATPADIAGWLELALDSIAGLPTTTAGGTSDALTADFVPDLVLSDGKTFIVRAATTNTTTTPTVDPDGSGPLTIVKGNNLPLLPGDIAGAGHWLEFQYDTTLTKAVLMNPAKGVSPVPGGGATGAGGDQIFFESDTVVTSSYTVGEGAYQSGVAISIATPAVFTLLAHGFTEEQYVHLRTTGALPTGLAVNTPYYVIAAGLTADAFQLSLTKGGAAINTSGVQSGVQSVGRIKNSVVPGPLAVATGKVVTVENGSVLTVV